MGRKHFLGAVFTVAALVCAHIIGVCSGVTPSPAPDVVFRIYPVMDTLLIAIAAGIWSIGSLCEAP